MKLDFDVCYRAICSRDERFDGRFFTGVTSTGIYCRPICSAQTPQPRNVRFYHCAAAAEAAGFRACRRCRPETAPGSPDWNVRADLVARALRLIAEGCVDVSGVSGLAQRLAVSERHLHRELMAEIGAGVLTLARTRRAQTARLMVEHTTMPLGVVAYAAGFKSIRQFNETMQDAFGCTPMHLRGYRQPGGVGGGSLTLHLPYRPPFEVGVLFSYLDGHAIPGVEEVREGRYRRTVVLPRSKGIIELEPAIDANHMLLRLHLDDLLDLSLLTQRCKHLFDLEAVPAIINEVLCADSLLAPLIAARPGLRVPGTIDGFELAVRAILGQQVSIAGARTLAGRLVTRAGTALPESRGTLTHFFPSPEAVADANLDGLGITGARITALRALASAVVKGEVMLDRGTDRQETESRLVALPGIGPWTASYIAMRALGDPDAMPVSDLGLRRSLEQQGFPMNQRELVHHAEAWRPWRAYAVHHLWASLTPRSIVKHTQGATS